MRDQKKYFSLNFIKRQGGTTNIKQNPHKVKKECHLGKKNITIRKVEIIIISLKVKVIITMV